MRGKKGKSKVGFAKYLPVLLILLSITIMVGSTFAYFTDRKDTSSDLTFSKVELSAETTLGIDGVLRDVIPGSKIVDGPVVFSKAIDSEAIYVRAKISFTLPEEYADDEYMVELVKLLTKSSNFNIVDGEQNGAVWSEKDGNYFYLLNNDDTTKLMRVDSIDAYVLSNEIIIPRTLEQLEGNAQYMKSINFHIAFEAIQADNVSDVLTETKSVFDVIFPTTDVEDKYSPTFDVIFTGADKETVFNVTKVEDGETLSEPTLTPEGESERAMFDGWYTDKALTIPFKFNEPITADVTLYPKYVVGDTLTIMSQDGQNVMMRVLVPDGEKTVEPTSSAFVDENGTSTHIADGYYTDIGYTNEFEFGTTINQSYTLYPKLLAVSIGLEFAELNEAVATNNSPDFRVSNEGGVTSYSVADGTCADAYIVVPAYYLGKPVTQVATNGFNGNTTITDVVLPNTIHTINLFGFQNCTRLVNIKMPMSLITIGSYAFNGCTRLVNAEIPESVTTIENYAFNKCQSLTCITISDSVTSIGEYAFSGCYKVTEINYNLTSGLVLGSSSYIFTNIGRSVSGTVVNIGANVKEIPAYLFYPNNPSAYAPNITSVVFKGAECTKIGTYAFAFCSYLTSIELPNGITSIGSYAFVNGAALENIIIPSSITSIGVNAFTNTNNAYILCPDSKVAGYAKGKGSTNVYVVDSTTDFSAITFTDATSGVVNGTYNDGTNYYVRTGSEGSYVYYKKYTA